VKSIKEALLPFLFVLASTVVVAQIPAPSSQIQPVERSGRVVLRGNVHPLARAEFDRGPAPDDLPQRRMLLLLRRSPAQDSALERLLQEQWTKSSPNYQQWITPPEFASRFGPSDADIQNVTNWLTANGFAIDRIAAGRNVIEFSGSAGQVRNAFQTEIHSFLVNGEEHWANATDPQIPAALASTIGGIVSLNDFPRPPLSHELGLVQRSPLTEEWQPTFTFTPPGRGTINGIGPADFATIYNVQPLWDSGIDGSGQEIAIVAESNINLSDVQSFRSLFGLPVKQPQIILNGPDPGLVPGGAETEAVADVEWSGAVAKNATIDLVVSSPTETTSGVDLSALYIVENNLAPVLSVSFGGCEPAMGATENAFVNELWKQAAAQGITVVVSSGDSLAAGCDAAGSTFATKGLAVSGAASTPYNVAVGGTDFDESGNHSTYWNSTNDPATGRSAKSYIPEMAWNISCAQFGISGCANNATNSGNAGAGGGPSSIYGKPSWQTGPGVPGDGKRDIPDVSLFSAVSTNTSFYFVCESDKDPNSAPCSLSSTSPFLLGIGGTSISAQAFAGVMALVNQNQQAHGHSARQGNANYVLYKIAAQPNASCNSTTAPLGNSSCVFYDTTKGNISADCQLNSLNCGGPGPFTGVLVDPNSANTPAWTTTAGFDLATGLGSVNVQNLATTWAGSAFTPTATILAVSPMTITHGQPATVNISVAPTAGSGTPSGDVSLIAQTGGAGRGLDVFTLNSNGAVNQSTSSLAGGTYNVIAHYAGDGTFAGSDSNPVSVTVNPEPSKTLLSLVTFDPTTGQISNSNASTTPYGSPYILRIDVGNSALSSTNLCSQGNSLSCPTGSINLSSDTAPLDAGTYKLNSKGIAEDLAIQLSGGVHNLQAQYSGDSSYQASTGTSTLTITPAPTSISGFNGQCCVTVGTPLTMPVTVTAQSNGVAPTGRVTLFQDGGQTLSGSATLSPSSNTTGNTRSAQASLSVTIATSGFHNFTVQYSGDQNYAASSAVTPSIDAQFLPTITLSANPQTVTYPGQTTITAVLHTGRTSPTPTGTMQLSGLSGTNLSSPTLTNITDPDGSASLQLTQTYQPVISSDINATFFGDPNYQQVSLTGLHITVNGGPDFSLSPSATNLSVSHGQSTTTTVTITDLNGFNGPVTLTCSVQGAPVSCSAAPNPVTPAAGSTTATATVTINAMAVAGIGRRTMFELFSFVFAGLILASRPRKRRGGAPLVLTTLIVLSVASISCGGGGGGSNPPPPPPPQTATITLTGSASALNQFPLTHTATITVTVQ
jgi:pro-kumamolisin-like protein/Big-like domain-containing protein